MIYTTLYDGKVIRTMWKENKFNKKNCLKQRGTGSVFGVTATVERNDDGIHWDYVLEIETNNISWTPVHSTLAPTAYLYRKGFDTEEEAIDAVAIFAYNHGLIAVKE